MVGSFCHLLIKIRIHTVIATRLPCREPSLLFHYLKYVAVAASQKSAFELFGINILNKVLVNF